MLLKIAEGTIQNLKKVAGEEYAGPCPSCGGVDRFRVWPGKGKWWCRGCGKSGDAIEPLAKLVRQGFSILWNPHNSVKCAGMELHLDGERGDRGQNSLILDALLPWTQCCDDCSWF